MIIFLAFPSVLGGEVGGLLGGVGGGVYGHLGHYRAPFLPVLSTRSSLPNPTGSVSGWYADHPQEKPAYYELLNPTGTGESVQIPSKIFSNEWEAKVDRIKNIYSSTELYGPTQLYASVAAPENASNFGVTFPSVRARRLGTLHLHLGDFNTVNLMKSLNGVIEKAEQLIENAVEGGEYWKDEAVRNHWIENRFTKIKSVAEKALESIEPARLLGSTDAVETGLPYPGPLYVYIEEALLEYTRMNSKDLCDKEYPFLRNKLQENFEGYAVSDKVGTMLDYLTVGMICEVKPTLLGK